ncbi:MAG: BofC C-terminal domain-containing protein [Limnochordia bacterium]|jgi:hypothetical protein
MVPTKGKWTVFWLGTVVFTAGFALGVVLHYRDLTMHRAWGLIREEAAPDWHGAVIEYPEPVKSGSRLAMVISYDDGCREELPIRPLPLRAVGKTREELSAQYGDWKILEFSPELVRVETEGGPCPFHARLYLGIADGYAAVFQGRPGRGGVVLKKTNVPLHRIPETERQRLSEGIPVGSEQEALQILEGMGEERGGRF